MTDELHYGAKSTHDPHGSIPGQLADCLAAMPDENRLVETYSDQDASAYSGNRDDGLRRMMEHAERIAPCIVRVQHSDRLARGDGKTARHLVEYALWALKRDVTIASVQDPQTFGDLLYAVVTGQRNHEDSARKSKAVQAGMRRLAQRGRPNGGPRPYGYQWASELVDGRAVSHLAVIPREAMVVRRIYSDTIHGASQTAIARQLNVERVPSTTGKPWTQGAVRRVLINVFYAGVIRSGTDEFPGQHDAIVDRGLWEQARVLRDAAARTKGHGGGRYPKGSHLFVKGLLRCGLCGFALLPTTKPTRTPGTTYDRYLCDGRRQHGTGYCEQQPIDRALVDGAMLTELQRRYLDIDATRDRLAAKLALDTQRAAESVTHAEREAAAAAARLQRVQRAFQDGHLDPVDYAEQAAGLREEREAAVRAAQRATDHLASVRGQVPALDAEEELLRHLAALRAAVVGGIGKAPNLDATRTLLRWLFPQVLYLAPGHPWLTNPGFIDDMMPRAAGGYLLLDPNPDVFEYVNADGTPYFTDDPNVADTDLIMRIHRQPLALDSVETQPIGLAT
jgi:DNA invertase Pin-like site-specific DNA recombinase